MLASLCSSPATPIPELSQSSAIRSILQLSLPKQWRFMIALLIWNSRRHLCWQNQPFNQTYSYLITLPNEAQINRVLLWQVLPRQKKVWALLSSQSCKITHFLSLKTCTHSSCRNGGRGFRNDLKKKKRMISNSLRRNESKTRGMKPLLHSTLLMEFGVCGVSSFSADGLFPSTSFPATKKCDSETE